jgi:hypothetical protein
MSGCGGYHRLKVSLGIGTNRRINEYSTNNEYEYEYEYTKFETNTNMNKPIFLFIFVQYLYEYSTNIRLFDKYESCDSTIECCLLISYDIIPLYCIHSSIALIISLSPYLIDVVEALVYLFLY